MSLRDRHLYDILSHWSTANCPTANCQLHTQLKALRQDLADNEAQAARASRLLKIADPDG